MSDAVMRLRRAMAALSADGRGVGAIEFAMTAPFLILLYLGGYQLMDAISAYRKVTTATRTMADLTTREEEVSSGDLDMIMNASQQVMIPYATGNAVMRLTQIRFDDKGKAKVDWSVSVNGKKMTNGDLNGKGKGKGNKVDIPDDIQIPNTYVIYSELTYPYTPVAGGGLIGPITFSDQLFMNPRKSDQVICNDQGKGNGTDKC